MPDPQDRLARLREMRRRRSEEPKETTPTRFSPMMQTSGISEEQTKKLDETRTDLKGASFKDIALAIPRGVTQAGVEMTNLFVGERDEFTFDDADILGMGDAETQTGIIGKGFAQFLIPFSGTKYLSKIPKIGKMFQWAAPAERGFRARLLSDAGRGALVEFTFFDEDENLANYFEGTFLENDFAEYMAVDEDDGKFERRLKSTLVGAGFGILADGAMSAPGILKKRWKAANLKDEIDAREARELDELFEDHRAVREGYMAEEIEKINARRVEAEQKKIRAAEKLEEAEIAKARREFEKDVLKPERDFFKRLSKEAKSAETRKARELERAKKKELQETEKERRKRNVEAERDVRKELKAQERESKEFQREREKNMREAEKRELDELKAEEEAARLEEAAAQADRERIDMDYEDRVRMMVEQQRIVSKETWGQFIGADADEVLRWVKTGEISHATDDARDFIGRVMADKGFVIDNIDAMRAPGRDLSAAERAIYVMDATDPNLRQWQSDNGASIQRVFQDMWKEAIREDLAARRITMDEVKELGARAARNRLRAGEADMNATAVRVGREAMEKADIVEEIAIEQLAFKNIEEWFADDAAKYIDNFADVADMTDEQIDIALHKFERMQEVHLGARAIPSAFGRGLAYNNIDNVDILGADIARLNAEDTVRRQQTEFC